MGLENMLKRIFLVCCGLFVAGLIYSFLALQVNNEITPEDTEAIGTLAVQEICGVEAKSYADELACIVAIQGAVQAIGTERCTDKKDSVEPGEFLKRGYGCCNDRARFIEKAARHYGFETRHVFLIEPKWGAWSNALPLGQGSHATSEVKTSRGWLGVDANHPFILVDQNNHPLTYILAMDKPGELGMEPLGFYSQELDIIYGLYSRHGNFHGTNFPGPEFVISEVFYNLYGG
ncbi:MAG: transglutaminase domain-containing protein [Rhizobiaceae bacterium]